MYEDVYAIGRHILSAGRDRTITRTSVLVDPRNAIVKSRRIGSGRLQRGCDGAKEDVGTGPGDAVEVSILRLASRCSVGRRLSIIGVDVAWRLALATEHTVGSKTQTYSPATTEGAFVHLRCFLLALSLRSGDAKLAL